MADSGHSVTSSGQILTLPLPEQVAPLSEPPPVYKMGVMDNKGSCLLGCSEGPVGGTGTEQALELSAGKEGQAHGLSDSKITWARAHACAHTVCTNTCTPRQALTGNRMHKRLHSRTIPGQTRSDSHTRAPERAPHPAFAQDTSALSKQPVAIKVSDGDQLRGSSCPPSSPFLLSHSEILQLQVSEGRGANARGFCPLAAQAKPLGLQMASPTLSTLAKSELGGGPWKVTGQ